MATVFLHRQQTSKCNLLSFPNKPKKAFGLFHHSEFTSRNSVTSLRKVLGESPRPVVFSTPADWDLHCRKWKNSSLEAICIQRRWCDIFLKWGYKTKIGQDQVMLEILDAFVLEQIMCFCCCLGLGGGGWVFLWVWFWGYLFFLFYFFLIRENIKICVIFAQHP